ncbi:hypothetical protein [Tropicibacter sp. S64]|uniref:hypothetical protein n=1 Tax=Tropicibacter sp. S64 TaxID=3415122 RepID=UPI003C7CF524
MYIKRVEFSGFRADLPGGSGSGCVALITDSTRVQIPLTVPHAVEVLKSRHRLRLLALALKQARRMPEYLNGEEIRFAPGILPHGLTSADRPDPTPPCTADLTIPAPAPKSERTPFRRRKVPPCPPPPMTA